jgi:hypothetical protein
MCPDCTRIASENKRLQRIKIAADNVVAALHIRYTADNTDLSRIMKKQIDEYEASINEGQIK